jgi:putative acetyltransferase
MPHSRAAKLPTGIALRAAHPADAPAIASVHARAIRALATPHYTEDQLDAWVARTTAASCLQAMDSRSLLVAVTQEPEPQVVGYGQLHLDEGVVEAIYVDPDHAHRGIGRALGDALEDIARKFDVEWLVADASLNAVPFYRALGYREVAEDRHEPAPGVHFVCTVMEKEVARPSRIAPRPG